jgi:hypothetical protein
MVVSTELTQPRNMAPEHGLSRFARPLLLISLVVLVLTTIAQVWVSWRTDSMMDDVAGSWVALAADLKNGVFYRPLYGPLGYGGTRYFPLHFAVQAVLMKAGLDVVLAGRLIELFSMAILLAGIYLLLRGLEVEAWLAACSALLVLATPSGQVLLNVRGDVLPASLNVLGLAICVKQVSSRWRLVASSILFTLAFAAKPTTVFGLITLVVVFLLGRRFKIAWRLVAMTLAGYILVLAAIYFGSQGRAFEVFRACALGGGTWRSMLKGPLRIAILAAGTRPQNGAAFIVLGFAVLLAWEADLEGLIPPVFLVSTTLVSAVIMGTPGADENHLLDLYVASIIMFSSWLKGKSQRHMTFGVCLLAVATLFTLPEQLDTLWYRTATGLANPRDPQRILQFVGDPHKPILAENPILCIRVGQTPYVLDSNNFRIINERNPAFAEPLWKRLRGQSFDAVVLISDPQSDAGQFWYKSVHFGPGFIDELNASYYLAARISDQFVFLPRRR